SIAAYVVAGLVPAVYIIIDTLRTRVFNPITVLAATSALAGGALAFLRVEGAAFALKDSYGSIVAALVMGGSLAIRRPFFQAFLRVALATDDPARKGMVERLIAHPVVQRSLALGTLVVFLEAVVLGTVNFLVNFNIVTGSFGTEVFNDQVARANVIMRPVSLVASFAAYGYAFYMAQAGATRAFGPKAKLFEDEMWEALAEPQAEPQAEEPQAEPPAEPPGQPREA
ncbi:MAG TPA: VC0807 family protein, partial [Deinococcales bacterium]|nr:VC0807 family protein [Deinococcales bacterium]